MFSAFEKADVLADYLKTLFQPDESDYDDIPDSQEKIDGKTSKLIRQRTTHDDFPKNYPRTSPENLKAA